MMIQKLPIVFCFVCVFVVIGCSKKDNKKTGVVCDGSNLTYNSGIASIINANCTSSNCHGGNSPHGNYTTYGGMQTIISSGSFNSQVLISQSMPQRGDLTQSQLNKLKCWVDNGYPEN